MTRYLIPTKSHRSSRDQRPPPGIKLRATDNFTPAVPTHFPSTPEPFTPINLHIQVRSCHQAATRTPICHHSFEHGNDGVYVRPLVTKFGPISLRRHSMLNSHNQSQHYLPLTTYLRVLLTSPRRYLTPSLPYFVDPYCIYHQISITHCNRIETRAYYLRPFVQ